jgi:hypothetical protein
MIKMHILTPWCLGAQVLVRLRLSGSGWLLFVQRPRRSGPNLLRCWRSLRISVVMVR